MTEMPSIHGMSEVPWDFARIPTKVWSQLERMPNGCWHAPENRAEVFRDTIVERVLGVTTDRILAAIPTCGSRLCVRPEHTCVTLVTPLSYKEK